MTVFDWMNVLSIIILVGFIIALGFLIALLWRANRVLYKLDHLGRTFQEFVRDAIPAIVNVGTVATAIQAVLKSLAEHVIDIKKSTSKGKDK